jgi:hypothetical protein
VRSRAVIVSVLAAGATIGAGGCGDDAPRRSDDAPRRAADAPAPAPARWPADEVLSHPPYLGVACPEPNSIGCDRVGLAVWLERPARAVTATIGDRRFALDDDHWPADSRGDAHIGYLEHAGLKGTGPLGVKIDEPPDRLIRGDAAHPDVTLRITFHDGRSIVTTTSVGLHPGWG